MPSASSSLPAPQRTPDLRELLGGVDALDAELRSLVGRRLLKVGAISSEVEFTLRGHVRALSASRVYLELSVSSSSMTATSVLLPFPQRDWGWRLYEVMASPGWPTRPATGCPGDQADAEGAVRRRRDDMLRRVFS
jgi:hypothetical protein